MSTEDSVRSATDELRQRIADLERDLAALGPAAKDAAREKLHDVREGAAAYCHDGRAKVEGIERTIEKTIVEQPARSLFVALGVGFILGALWMRR